MKHIIAILAILLLVFSIAGCDEDEVKQIEEEMEEQEGSAEADVEEASEGGFAEKFTDFVSMKSGLQFKVVYDLQTTSSGKKDSYVLTQYFGGPGRYRMDGMMDGQESRMFMVDDEVISCGKDDGEWTCMKFVTGEQMTQDPTEQFTTIEDNPDDYDIGYAGTMKVAGTTAYCYSIDYAYVGADAEMKYCFSKEGVPLYLLIDAEGFRHEMKAKSYTKGVKDSDFKPPVTPMDMNAMMGQYGQGMPEGYEMPDY